MSVVIPTFNAERTIGDLLHSILAGSYPRDAVEIVVVDNGSSDETRRIVGEFPVTLVDEVRRGPAHARNRGIAAASADILAFTDADCVVTTHWLEELTRPLVDAAADAAAGEILAFPPNSLIERYTATRKSHFLDWTAMRQRPWFAFMNAAVTRAAFARVGLFDPRFGAGAEDIDFCWRFAAEGLTCAVRREAVVFHRHRSSARGLFKQHYGYGQGQALLLDKYPTELRWSAGQAARAWTDLIVTAARALGTAPRSGDRGERGRLLLVDMVRKTAQRLGFTTTRVALFARRHAPR